MLSNQLVHLYSKLREKMQVAPKREKYLFFMNNSQKFRTQFSQTVLKSRNTIANIAEKEIVHILYKKSMVRLHN